MPIRERLLTSTGFITIFGGVADTGPPPPPPRGSLTGQQGTYKPTIDTVGAYGTLAPGPTGLVSINAGVTYEGLDCPAYFQVRTSQPVIFRNCLIRGYNRAFSGSGSDTALISCDYATNTGFNNVLIEDCTIDPDYPNTYIDGVIGHDFEIRRCLIQDVVDGIGARNTTNTNGPANVKVYANWIRSLSFIKPDPHHTDFTHNDGVQIFGNSNYRIVGNFIEDNMSTTAGTQDSPYNPSNTGQAIGITPTVGAVSDCVFDRNWLNYGANSITVAQATFGTSTTATITNNKFGRNQPNIARDGVVARRPILIANTLSIAGFDNTQAIWSDTVNGNVFEDDGTPAVVYRGAGL